MLVNRLDICLKFIAFPGHYVIEIEKAMTIFAQKLKPIFFIYCIWFSLCYDLKFSVFKSSAVKVRK